MNFSSDTLNSNGPPEPQESRRVILFLSLALIFLIISAAGGGIVFASSVGIKPGTILERLRSLTLSREKMLRGEGDGRINILLLGMGGAGHDGATLTDTIVFVSLRPLDGAIGMLSIPRDLTVRVPGRGYQRINAVNAYGESDAPGTGASATAEVVSTILSQPIHYYLRVDFQAFKEIIDTVGGIEVEVERAFVDHQYPDDNFGYQTISFKAGRQRLSGARALQFVRSRHGSGGEGNDFARARRQQKVLFALKDRLLSFDVLLRPKRLEGIVATLQDHLQTNIVFWEGLRFAKLLRKINASATVSKVLEASEEGVLTERVYNGAFVLEPKDGTWKEVRAIAAELLD